MRFKEFMQMGDDMGEEKADIQKTISNLPPRHAALVQGFKWKFHPGNTLNGDSQHVGYMDKNDREIAVAAPWNYGREFTILHEIGHRVWETMPQELKQKWHHLVSKTLAGHIANLEQEGLRTDSLKQEPEELFCMTYGAAHSKNPPHQFCCKPWLQFVKSLN